MTEIPEHLLKRSRERRAALGLGGDDSAGDAAPADTPADTPAATPATTGDAAPATAAAPSGPAGRAKAAAPAPPPPPPKPDPAYVMAAKTRPKIPFWAMSALSLLPIWMFMYVRSVTEAPEVVEGPLGEGAEAYGACASCHGTAGAGVDGLGYQFSEGEVLLTFPHIEDHLRFVYFGTADYQLAGVQVYGNPEREGGTHETGARGVMPRQGGAITDEEILSVVCHERYTLGGADPESEEYLEEYTNWCSEESPVFLAIEGGETLATIHEAELVNEEGDPIEIIPIGEEPVEGSPPGDAAPA